MRIDWLALVGGLVSALPLLTIVFVVLHYSLRRAAWKRAKRRGKKYRGFCPSTSAMGNALLFLQIFHRPSVAYVVEAKLDEEAEEDDNGGPETPEKQLHRQLRKIRRGERLDRLVLRL